MHQLAELQAKLIKQFHVHVTSVVLDLSDTEAAEKLFRYAQEKGIVIDTLVNCAGFGDWADFMHEDRRKLNAMMQVNMVTLAKLMRLFGEDMVGRHGGRILNIASVAATIPGPYMAAYYASKAFVRSLSVAVAREVRGTGVTVTCICPGSISTGFERPLPCRGTISSRWSGPPRQRPLPSSRTARCNSAVRWAMREPLQRASPSPPASPRIPQCALRRLHERRRSLGYNFIREPQK